MVVFDSRPVIADVLMLWGIGLDGIILFLLPLLGSCTLWGPFIKFCGCNPNGQTVDTLPTMYVQAASCIVRTLAGVFWQEKAIWLAAMGTMILEPCITLSMIGLAPDYGRKEAMPATLLCLGTFVAMGVSLNQGKAGGAKYPKYKPKKKGK